MDQDSYKEFLNALFGVAAEQSTNKKADQYAAFAKEIKGIYDALINEGFTKDEAFVILNTATEAIIKNLK